jgi:DNA-binding NarL/FixJ family response regulator
MTATEQHEPVTVALLDDHELVLDGLAGWIRDHEPRFELVAIATTWSQLVRSAAFPPQLVIMDVQLPDNVSIEARVRTCRAAGAEVVVMTALDVPEQRDRALDAGAVAFLSKTAPARELVAAAARAVGLRAEAGHREVDAAHRVPEAGSLSFSSPALSDGERTALVLYIDGRTTGEVAAEMNVSFETAKTYLRRVRAKYAKAGRPTSTRTDLMRRAAEDGYLT